MKQIIITGAKGQLGTELIKIITSGESELGTMPEFYKDCELTAVDIDELNIADQEKTFEFIEQKKPYAVINCAAMTNVDACEDQQQTAMQANAIGPRNLACACERVGAKLVQVSTDYVFRGDGSRPYVESDAVQPQSVYGATKLLGEQYVRDFCSKWFIVRTAWLYGYHGKNFVKTIAKAGKKTGELKVVSDQRGNPTNAADLAWAICKLLPTQEYGVYHCTGVGECSWYDFACEIIKDFGINAKVHPCTTQELGRAANRPAYSSLDNLMLRCTVGDDTRDWKQALAVYAKHANLEE